MWGTPQPAGACSRPRGRRARLVWAAALVCCGLALMGARSPAAFADDPIGAHSMLQLDDPYSFMQSMFSQAANMHASAIRLDVAPALIFGDPSQPPDYSGLDEVMALSEQYHLRVVADLLTVPWWLADCETIGAESQMTRCGTDDLTAYGSMIAQIVRHADPVIRDWEVWNEPDTAQFFTGTPQQYAHMLRTAHDTIKGIDPHANVLLGGISTTGGMPWLRQVFATPGADAEHAFDIANVHERGHLDGLAPDISSWRSFLAGYGFSGPLWVTEHGYPSSPGYQYDPSYTAGEASQAAYLAASIPSMIEAGASEVFVTERDNLGGQFGSEGVVGGDVSDPPVPDPLIVEKPAFAVVRTIADCYSRLGRHCPGHPPVVSPASLTFPATRPGSSTTTSAVISDAGSVPLKLGASSMIASGLAPITIRDDSCSNQLLEPDQTCTVSLRYAPSSGGETAATLQLPSDSGSLQIPVSAVAPSVSSLASPQLAAPRFTPTDGADGVGHTQRLALELANPLSAAVKVRGSSLSGANSRRFRVLSDRCDHNTLQPGARCRLSVRFTPTGVGSAKATLTLRGAGEPLSVPLRATAYALPSITALGMSGSARCVASASQRRIEVETNQPATLRWRVVALGGTPGCGPGAGAGRWSIMQGGRAWSLLEAWQRDLGTFGLAGRGGRLPLAPGRYGLTVQAVNGHGAGPARTMLLELG